MLKTSKVTGYLKDRYVYKNSVVYAHACISVSFFFLSFLKNFEEAVYVWVHFPFFVIRLIVFLTSLFVRK